MPRIFPLSTRSLRTPGSHKLLILIGTKITSIFPFSTFLHTQRRSRAHFVVSLLRRIPACFRCSTAAGGVSSRPFVRVERKKKTANDGGPKFGNTHGGEKEEELHLRTFYLYLSLSSPLTSPLVRTVFASVNLTSLETDPVKRLLQSLISVRTF